MYMTRICSKYISGNEKMTPKNSKHESSYKTDLEFFLAMKSDLNLAIIWLPLYVLITSLIQTGIGHTTI